jgi:hypothetical protein
MSTESTFLNSDIMSMFYGSRWIELLSVFLFCMRRGLQSTLLDRQWASSRRRIKTSTGAFHSHRSKLYTVPSIEKKTIHQCYASL